MATLVLRATKGAPLTIVEVDGNFSGLSDGSLWAAAVAAAGTLQLKNLTPPPAGGMACLLFGNAAGFGVYAGSGAPTISAGKGSLYLRTDGSSSTTRMYVNTDGGTTWTAVNTVA